jgi:hypothetical protein
MSRSTTMQWLVRLGVCAAAAAIPVLAAASDRVKGASERIDPKQESVELFAGIEKGQLEAVLIPKDSSECRVMVKNLTDRPLNVLLPEAFAGVPVLAQQGVFAPNNANNANNAPQNLGGGFPNNNLQGNNNNNNFFNMPGNNLFNVPNNNRINRGGNPFQPMFNIAAEKVGQFHLDCVCLDHGRPNPRPQIRYQIKPLASVTNKPEVRELCAMLGRGEVDQKAAQAAAWHFNNGMTWEQLKAKEVKIAMGRIREPYFTPKELAAAKKAAEQVTKGLTERQKPSAKSESLSRK